MHTIEFHLVSLQPPHQALPSGHEILTSTVDHMSSLWLCWSRLCHLGHCFTRDDCKSCFSRASGIDMRHAGTRGRASNRFWQRWSCDFNSAMTRLENESECSYVALASSSYILKRHPMLTPTIQFYFFQFCSNWRKITTARPGCVIFLQGERGPANGTMQLQRTVGVLKLHCVHKVPR